MGRWPWREVLAALVAMVALLATWAVARGAVDESGAGLVNSVAGLLAALVVLAATVRAGRRHQRDSSHIALSGEVRRALIDKVRSRWVGASDGSVANDHGKLAQDLHLGYIEVRLKALSTTGTEDVGLTVQEAWTRSGHGLVLLGELGAGKSVQLLMLAKNLMADAESSPEAGVPVVVGLSNCALREQKRPERLSERDLFEEWLSAEVSAQYRVPRGSVTDWIQQGRLIPILDGFDEVAEDQRARIFNGLTAWLLDPVRPVAAWALGSRLHEFAAQDADFRAFKTVHAYWTVPPLRGDEGMRFLASLSPKDGDAWHSVLLAVRAGTELQQLGEDDAGTDLDLLSTPLGLTLVADAYLDVEMPDGAPMDLLDQGLDWDRLWTRYVERRYRMSHAEPGGASTTSPRYSLEDTRRWLGNMASGRLGLRGGVDVVQLPIPPHPSQWQLIAEVARNPFIVFGGLLGAGILWSITFAPFGALVAWREWAPGIAVVVALTMAVICLITIVISGLAYDEVAGVAWLAVVELFGLPGLLAMSFGWSWPGEPLARRLSARSTTSMSMESSSITRTFASTRFRSMGGTGRDHWSVFGGASRRYVCRRCLGGDGHRGSRRIPIHLDRRRTREWPTCALPLATGGVRV